MKPERRQEIERIYHAALERKESGREVYLDGACGKDTELRREVASLLGDEGKAKEFIDETPAIGVAARSVANDAEGLIGQRIGSYNVISLLGRGGMDI